MSKDSEWEEEYGERRKEGSQARREGEKGRGDWTPDMREGGPEGKWREVKACDQGQQGKGAGRPREEGRDPAKG